MTREEAKKILKRIVNTSNEITHPVILNTEMEAIKVAIEALLAKDINVPSNGDAISRQDAIDACLNGCCACVSDCVDEIEKLPSAEPVIRCKDCKWCIEHYDTDGNAPYWICRNWDGGTDADGFCHEAERKEQ